ncbi:MAG: DUF3108 domain-containing protein [Acidobacteriaceae bacterium]
MAVRMAPLRVWKDSTPVVMFMATAVMGACLGLVCPATARAQLFSKAETPVVQRPIPVLQPPLPTFDYPQHETLRYTVDWRVFTAGVAVFHLDQVGNALKISATADSVGAVNLLFPVVDGFQSGFDLKTGCSTGFDKQTQEGRRKIASDLSFDYEHGKQTRNERNLVKGTATHSVTNIPACVTDSLSAMFYTQSQTLTPGQTVYFPLADAMRTVTVGMKVEDHEEIKTPAGTFQTIKVQATADEGIVKNRGSIWIWYTDDARHLPVQMQARLFWGTITFHLQSVDFK